MTTIYQAIIDFIKDVKNEENVNLTRQEINLNESGRKGKMTLKWWKENKMLIISDIVLETPNKNNRHVLKTTLSKLMDREREDLDNARLSIDSILLEGIYNTELRKKLIENGWYLEGLSNLRYY
jgi:hypothetical protein